MSNTEIKAGDVKNEEEKEPMLLLDTTGSMTWATSETDQTPRCDTIKEALTILVEELAKEDSAKKKGEEEDEGGLRTITFAGGFAHDIGDLNPDNLKAKWSKIKFEGGTRIMAGWNKLFEVYNEEFGTKSPKDRPKLLAVIITDGQADDTDAFAKALGEAKDFVFVNLVIIGFGKEHDAATKQYQKIAEVHRHVTVTQLDASTDPQGIADKLSSLME